MSTCFVLTFITILPSHYHKHPSPDYNPSLEEHEQIARQVSIKATEGHRAFGKLLKRVYGSNEHVIIIERDGFPVAMLLSYQEYEHLSQALTETEEPTPEGLPAPGFDYDDW